MSKAEKITRERFLAATGHEPVQDDLERCNCKHAGKTLHSQCGWDEARDMPRFVPGENALRNAGAQP